MNLIKQTNCAGYTIFQYDLVTTTMDVAKQFPPNTIVMAQGQTSGRGKVGRVWSSENTGNLYMSMLLSADSEARDYSQLSFLSSVAVLRTIKTLSPNINVKSKWPNDTLIDGKKVCGVLLEFDRKERFMVIGVGVNISTFPDTAMFRATSLKNEGIIVDKYDFVHSFLDTFNVLLREWKDQGFSPIRTKWLQNCYKLHEKIVVNEKEGTFVDLDKDGTLIMKLNNGEDYFVKSGDVFPGCN